MNWDSIIEVIQSQNLILWAIVLTGLVVGLPLLRFFVRWISSLKTGITTKNYQEESDDDEGIGENDDENYDEDEEYSYDEGDEEQVIDNEDEEIESREEIMMQQDPDEITREHLYRERLWSEIEYNKRKSKWDDYEKKLIEGLSHDQSNHDIIKTLAEYYFNAGQTKKALPLLKKIVDHYPEDHKTLRQIAEIYLEGGDFETSELLTKQALTLAKETPKYAITLTEIYYHTDRIDESIKTMENVVKRRPSRIGYREALIKLYEEVREYELALECCHSILEIDSNNIKAKKKSLELRNKL